MAIHNIRGRIGEDLAAGYLNNLGFHIQQRNWRTSFYEIDIIAVKEQVLHFIEVKTRHSLRFGYPEENVTAKKLANIKKAATYYLQINPFWNRIQFDILSITCLAGKPTECLLIEDVYD